MSATDDKTLKRKEFIEKFGKGGVLLAAGAMLFPTKVEGLVLDNLRRARDIFYDKTDKGLTSSTVQGAIDELVERTNYGVCSTAVDTGAKTVTITNFVLRTGATVKVKFSNSNTAENPTLDVNSTGAKAIKAFGTTAPVTSFWRAGDVVEFIYDGSNWLMNRSNFRNIIVSTLDASASIMNEGDVFIKVG